MTTETAKREGTQAMRRSLLAACAGLLGYGGWALFVNYSAGIEMALRAAAVQGGYSFALTLGMTLVIERLFHGLPQKHAAWLTVVLSSIATWCVAFGIHTLNGTPNVIATILPGFIVGIIYTTLYVVALKAGQRKVQVA